VTKNKNTEDRQIEDKTPSDKPKYQFRSFDLNRDTCNYMLNTVEELLNEWHKEGYIISEIKMTDNRISILMKHPGWRKVDQAIDKIIGSKL
jgi:hypothetical protein